MNFLLVIAAGLFFFIAGCTGSKNVTLELKNATSLSRNHQIRGATDQTSSVTIDSLKIPISDVGLSFADELYGSSESGMLYQCGKTTAAGCEVELVGDTLENLLTGGDNTGSLQSGKTYSSVMIGT